MNENTPPDNTQSKDSGSKRPSASDQRTKRKGGMHLARTALLLCGLFVIGAFAIATPMLMTGTDHEAMIYIPDHATRQDVRDSLAKHFGETFAGRVDRLINARTTDMSRRAGAYLIRKGDTPFNAMRRLTSGAQQPIRLPVTNARTIEQVAQNIASRMQFSTADFCAVLADSTLMARYNLTPEQAIAIFIEASYDVYWNAKPKKVVEKIGHYYLNVWNGRRRAEAARLGLTPAEVMTLASIVEEETHKTDEMGKVARVYLNRLAIGMPLQSDPTVRYALNDFTIKRVTENHLVTESPYNTYRIKGLPPGPINTVSASTIDAVLSAPEADYLYMCAKEDFSGYHNFASSYEEHLKNAHRYQEELNRRNIH